MLIAEMINKIKQEQSLKRQIWLIEVRFLSRKVIKTVKILANQIIICSVEDTCFPFFNLREKHFTLKCKPSGCFI